MTQESDVVTSVVSETDPNNSVVAPEGATATPITGEVKPEKTFTQAELDEIVEKRLGKERQRNEKRYAQTLERVVTRQQPTAQPQAQPEGAPKRDQFQSDEDYALAVVDHRAEAKAKQYLEAKGKQDAEARQQNEQQKLAQTFQERAAKTADKYDDYEEVTSNPSLNISPAMAFALQLHEQGPEIAYHLGKNPQEAARLATLHPLQAAIEIGRLTAKLEATPAKPKAPSNAPDPITPVGTGKPSAVSELPSDKDDPETWLAKRHAQLAKRRGRG